MTASEIRALAAQAGIAPGSRCWTCAAGLPAPGGSSRGSWAAPTWVSTPARARCHSARARGRPALPLRGRTDPAPPGRPFDVVLLLETMLAFEDKDALVREISAALGPGGRFAFTLEEGQPLTAAERAAMPDADTVWLTPLDEMAASLERAGSSSRGRRTTAARTARSRRRCWPRSPRTPGTSPRRSAAGRWTSCSPLTGCGSSGWPRAGCASSRWWRSGPGTRRRVIRM